MKKLLSIFALFSALVLSSCVKEQTNADSPVVGKVQLTITTGEIVSEEIASGEISKTYFDGTAQAKWTGNETMAVYVGTIAGESDNLTGTTADHLTMTFSGAVTAEEGTHTVYGFVPASMFSKNNGNGEIRFTIPKEQHPTATSFDPAADLLIAQPKEVEIDGTSATLDGVQFRRPLAILKVIVDATGCTKLESGEKIKSVKVTAPVGIAHYVKANIESYAGVEAYNATEKDVTLDLEDNPVDFGAPVYGLIAKGTWATGGSVKLDVTTTLDRVITKNITLAKDIVFEANAVKGIKHTITDDDIPAVPVTVTKSTTIAAYASAHSWSDKTQYSTITLGKVTLTANGGVNTGKYYTNGQEWRLYQSESASLTISVPEGCELKTIKLTYNIDKTGCLVGFPSGTTANVSGTSVTYTVGNTGTVTNGQAKITDIEVVYTDPDATPEPVIPVINVGSTTLNVGAEEGAEASTTVTVTNPVEGENIVATCDANWCTVNIVNGVLTVTAAKNTGGAQFCTVTLSYTGATSVTVTVNQAAGSSGGITVGDAWTYTFTSNTPKLGTTAQTFNGLSWVASLTPTSYESSGDNRGWSWGTAKGDVTVSTSSYSGGVKKMELVVSTNDAGNSIDVTVEGVALGSTVNLSKGDKNRTISFTSDNALAGTIVITIHDVSKSVYLKTISINPAN